MNYFLKKKEILRKREDFSYMRDDSSFIRSSCFVLIFKPSLQSSEYNKIGFLVTKKQIRLAVNRNKAKRLMREAYRLLKHRIKIGYYFLLIANKKILNCSMINVKNELESLLLEHSLLI